MVPIAHPNHGWAPQGVVITRKRIAIGPCRRDSEHITGGDISREIFSSNDNVSAFAMFPYNANKHRFRFGFSGSNAGAVASVIQGWPCVIAHPSIDTDIQPGRFLAIVIVNNDGLGDAHRIKGDSCGA
jgi:hypothetical protein